MSDAGFVASNTEKYPIEDVVAAIKNEFNNATPKISCAKKGAVKELWLCFDKSFEVIVFFLLFWTSFVGSWYYLVST